MRRVGMIVRRSIHKMACRSADVNKKRAGSSPNGSPPVDNPALARHPGATVSSRANQAHPITRSIFMRIYRLLAFAALGLVCGPHARSADEATEAIKQFVEGLKGEWQMTSRIDDGEASEEKLIKNRTITFEADRYTVRDEGKVAIEATYNVDPSKKPVWFDVTLTSGRSKGNMERGIIKIEGDVLTFCLAEDKSPRPSEFKSKKGDDLLLVTYKRVKK
jgi:uncharacterized protein (TIGR03067 family)